MILFDVTIEAKDDRRKEATGLLRRTMAGSQAEEGCLIYRFTADLDDPRLFHPVELWEPEAVFAGHATGAPRSEDHTSELQSPMRISYAVFYLNKKQTSQLKAPHTNSNNTSCFHNK